MLYFEKDEATKTTVLSDQVEVSKISLKYFYKTYERYHLSCRGAKAAVATVVADCTSAINAAGATTALGATWLSQGMELHFYASTKQVF